MASLTATGSVDAPAPRRGQYVANVRLNQPLCREHFRLVLHLPAFPQTQPGQFVQLQCRDPRLIEANGEGYVEHDWQPGQRVAATDPDLLSATAMLRRPFSLAGRRDVADGVELDVIHRVVGSGTRWLETLAPGDPVGVIGPLGNRFTVAADPRHIHLMVGGGVGIPPMIYLGSTLVGRRAVAFAGATTRDLLSLTVTGDAPTPKPDSTDGLYNIDEFARHGIPAVISTDDGSYGFKGYVTDALAKYLDTWITDNADRGRCTVYVCGPEIMMKKVAQIAADRQIACQVAVERAMACGMGTCQSCCIRVAREDLGPGEWRYALACTDGPVFEGAKLRW
jgi:dihydroorotate dehydrogenase electron transfer subunit